MWAKIITIKRAKDLNYFSLSAFNLFNTWVSQFELNYWTEINELFHDILIYWDAPVYDFFVFQLFNVKLLQKVKTPLCNNKLNKYLSELFAKSNRHIQFNGTIYLRIDLWTIYTEMCACA